jgi:gliding motility-associated-like protein
MKAIKYVWIYVIIITGSGGIAFGQVNADFTADQTTGCSPLVVAFTDNSTGENLTYSWDFGNGNSSTNKNPQATYTSPGTYTVTLTVSNGTATDESNANITVFSNPVADFQGDTKGCTPFTSQFIDNSTVGDAPINEWKWDFRSGFIDSRQNPSYTYTTAGSFDVYLEVVDENGCSGNIEKEAYVDVVQPPTSIFDMAPSVACEAPATVNFNNNSSGSGTITYDWDFGDESSSNDESPSHVFTSFGSYAVTLKVSSDYGCSTSTSKLFNIQDVSASGLLSQDGNSVSSEDVICPGMLDFKATTEDGINVYWDFGDGGFSNDTSGAHYYTNAGTYQIQLIATPGDVCADTVLWTIHVDEIVADFTFSPDYSCQSPVDVSFTSNSTNAVNYSWKFDDNTTSTEQNPVKTYSVSPGENPYTISSTNILSTTLTVENDNGCVSSVTKSMTIKKPTAQFKVDTVQGCKPLTVHFTDISQSDLEITNREWIFGDGEIVNSSQDGISHDYTQPGEFDSKLVITNEEGCTDTSYVITINVGEALEPDFQILPTTFCQNEELKFSYPPHLNEKINKWHYRIGNTPVPLDPAGSDTIWRAKLSGTGQLNAKLVVSYNGCVSETVKEDYLIANGPVAKFQKQMDCSQPFDYVFHGDPDNHVDFKWSFGDGTTNTTDITAMKNYSAEGDYQLEFIAINGTCSDTARELIHVREPEALIMGDTALCAGDSVMFDGSGSYETVNYCFEKYLWQFNDSARPLRTNKDTVYHVFNKPGEHNIQLITYYDNQCFDTAHFKVFAYQPFVGFESDITEGCAPVTINFKDTSMVNVHPFEKWQIDYGDGIDSSYFSGTSNFSHTYYNVGSYTVYFSVTDTFGCEAGVSKQINTANPSAEFTPLTDTETCAGNPVFFSHFYRESDSVRWNFGDGALSGDTSETISHEYADAGEFQVSLIVYQYGCTDTFKTQPDLVKIQKANAHFSVSDSFYNCYPELVEFTHDGIPEKDVAAGLWDFGFKNSTSEYAKNRAFTYPLPGEYTISLNVETSYGCEDNYSRKVMVTGPRGNFSMSAEAVCQGDEVTLTLEDTVDVYSFEWDLGDGNFVSGNPVTHRYYGMGNNIPKLILKGDSGRCLPPPIEDTLYVHELQAGFNIENPALCEKQDIIFSNTSFGQSNNEWRFSNGFTGTSENFASEFNPGDYSAKLIVSNSQGCSDTLYKSFTIHPLPAIWVMPDTFICRGQSVKIHATGGNRINWNPANDIENPSAYETMATPLFTTSYLAVITDSVTGCENQESTLVTVQQPPDIDVSPKDTSIIIGENVTFHIDSLTGYYYHWSPESFFPCPNCATVHATPFESTTITLLVSDDKDCFNIPVNIPVEVREEYSLAMPNSFTPNGDGVNDVVYIRGWGIKNLIEFRVFNRWGNEVFFTDNLTEGWDGTYKGKLQNIDSYAYIVQVETWEGNLVTKKGTITLLK